MTTCWSRRTVLRAAGAAALPVPAVACTDRPAPAPPDNTFVIRGARIFDGARLIDADSVLVEQGTITAVSRNVVAPEGAAVHDGAGRTLLPGLIDSHVHTSPLAASYGPAFGVTTMLDMGTDESLLPEFRRQRASSGRTASADVWSAGTLITVPGGHGTQYGIQIPTLGPDADPVAFVQARLDKGADFVKIIIEDGSKIGLQLPTLTAEQVNTMVAAARARGVRAAVHATTAASAAIAVAAGADLLAHVPVEPIDEALIGSIRQHGMAVVATLSVYGFSPCSGEAAALAADPRIARHLTPEQRSQLTRTVPTCPPPMLPQAMANVAALRRAGVPVLAGTDAGTPGTTHGASLHGELELLVRAGLDPTDALAAATSLPAERFGLTDRGRITPGRRADLVLVNGDPTGDITATRDIATMWKNGYQIPR